MISNRIRNNKVLNKICTAKEAAMLIKDGMNVGTSGFTPSGYPKAVPLALAELAKKTNEKFKINLYTGASVGDELDGALARADIKDNVRPLVPVNIGTSYKLFRKRNWSRTIN